MRNNRLRSIRSNRVPKMTAKELAQAVTNSGHEVSESMIYQIERGEKMPSLELAAAIARILGESIESLFLASDSTESAMAADSAKAS